LVLDELEIKPYMADSDENTWEAEYFYSDFDGEPV